MDVVERFRIRRSFRVRLDGGPGSGNFGHMGRPHHRGGSMKKNISVNREGGEVKGVKEKDDPTVEVENKKRVQVKNVPNGKTINTAPAKPPKQSKPKTTKTPKTKTKNPFISPTGVKINQNGYVNISDSSILPKKVKEPVLRYIDDSIGEIEDPYIKLAALRALAVPNVRSTKKKCYYSTGSKTIFLSTSARNGTSNLGVGTTVVHESFHYLDNMIGQRWGEKKTNSYFSVVYNNGEFGKTLSGELSKLLGDLGYMYSPTGDYSGTIKNLRMKLSDILGYGQSYWKLKTEDYGSISDLIGSATANRVTLGIGHKISYWANVDNQPIEAFAELAEGYVTSPNQRKIMEALLPDTCAVFRKMLKEANITIGLIK